MVARRGDLIAGGRAMMLRVYSHDITRSLVDIRRRRRDSAVRCPGSHRQNDDCKTGERGELGADPMDGTRATGTVAATTPPGKCEGKGWIKKRKKKEKRKGGGEETGRSPP